MAVYAFSRHLGGFLRMHAHTTSQLVFKQYLLSGFLSGDISIMHIYRFFFILASSTASISGCTMTS